MFLELSAEGYGSVSNRVLRACLGADTNHVDITLMQTTIWFFAGGEQVASLTAELMKLSEDEPLPGSERQDLLENIILNLHGSMSAMVSRWENDIVLATSASDDEFYLAKLFALKAASGLEGLSGEFHRFRVELLAPVNTH